MENRKIDIGDRVRDTMFPDNCATIMQASTGSVKVKWDGREYVKDFEPWWPRRMFERFPE